MAYRTQPARMGRQPRMNHAAPRLARALLSAALLAVAVLAAAERPVAAQTAGDMPADSGLDPAIDPFPFDPRLAVRDYLRRALPTRWWANEPSYTVGVWQVTVHVPDDWSGNPTAAMIGLCPPRESALWRHLDRIELVPFYRKAPRAGTTCRR